MTWLKGRVDDLQSQVLQTESSIEKLKVESGIRDIEVDKVREQQIAGLTGNLMTSREEVEDKRARLEQARKVIDNKGDIDSIPELTASPTLSELRRKQMELNWSAAELQNKMGERNAQVVSIRAQLATVSKQIDAEAEHILGNMKNAYDIAVQREQSLEANLQALTGILIRKPTRNCSNSGARLTHSAKFTRAISLSTTISQSGGNCRTQARGSSHRLRFRGHPLRLVQSSMRLPGWPASPAV